MIAADILAQVPVRGSGLFDPLYLDFLDGDPFVSGRFPSRHSDVDGWPGLAERRRGAGGPPGMWAALAAAHERWGAPQAARRGLDELAAGRAVAVIAGQQPDALGGPLYTLHKALTAVALARRFEARTGTRAVPMFWSANEDSDFEEVRTVRFLGAALEAHEVGLPASAHGAGGMVGGITPAALAESWECAAQAWRGLPGAGTVTAWLARARERAADLGDAQAILLLAALGESGLVVLDPRLDAFRAAARPLYARYLEKHERIRGAVEVAGQELVARGYGLPIQPAQSEFSLFGVGGGARLKLDGPRAAAALAAGRDLSPNVVLRPLVQDALLPTVFLVAGPGEIAYLSQLREVYQELDVPMSPVFPRLTATWLPAAAAALVRELEVEPWELVRDTDAAVRGLADRALPAPVRAAFERLRVEGNAQLRGFAESAAAVDASLPQVVESARGKVDYQYARILEALVAKSRTRLERAHPQAPRLRHALSPGGRPQERRLAWLDLVARGGTAALAQARKLAEYHVENALSGHVSHGLVTVPEGEAG